MSKKSKYVVFVDTQFYPYVLDEYDTLKKAKEAYTEQDEWDSKIYLCKIIDTKSGQDSEGSSP